jgi:hypothetical protein
VTAPHRRTFLKGAFAGLLGAPFTGALAQAVTRAATDDPLYPIASEVVQLRRTAPDLPGLVSLREWVAGYPTALSREDNELLLGALYLQGRNLATMARGYFTPTTIREGLQAPFAFSARLDRAYFQAVLAEARQASADPAGAQALRQGAEQLRALAFELGLPDDPDDPPALIIILVIAFAFGVGAGIWIGSKIWG